MNLRDAKEMTADLAKESKNYAFKLVCQGLNDNVNDQFVRKIYPGVFDQKGDSTAIGYKKLFGFFQNMLGEENKTPLRPTISDLKNAILKRHSSL